MTPGVLPSIFLGGRPKMIQIASNVSLNAGWIFLRVLILLNESLSIESTASCAAFNIGCASANFSCATRFISAAFWASTSAKSLCALTSCLLTSTSK